MGSYDRLPEGCQLQPSPFTLSVPEQDYSDFKDLLRLSKLAPKTYENLQNDYRFGVSHDWMSKAKEFWEKQFDWYACPAHSSPQERKTIAVF